MAEPFSPTFGFCSDQCSHSVPQHNTKADRSDQHDLLTYLDVGLSPIHCIYIHSWLELGMQVEAKANCVHLLLAHVRVAWIENTT